MRLHRVRGDGVKPAEPAGGEHRLGGVEGGALPGGDVVDKRAADRPVIVRQQIFDDDAFKDGDVLGRLRRRDKGLHDRRARLVARRVNDAVAAMSGFAPEDVTALVVPVEFDAVTGEILDRRLARVDKDARRFRVDEPRARFHGVGEMKVRRVVLAQRGGHAPLRPRRRAALAERPRRDHRHGPGRELQGGVEPCDAGADDEDVRGHAVIA